MLTKFEKLANECDNTSVTSTQFSSSIHRKQSNTSFASRNLQAGLSFLSQSMISTTLRAQNTLNKYKAIVPVVNIHSIIQQKPYLYMDKSLENNFDELLQRGYQIVVIKKNQQVSGRELEENLIFQNKCFQQEIVPLINSAADSKQRIEHQQALSRKLANDINEAKYNLQKIQSDISSSELEVAHLNQEFLQKILFCEDENNQARLEIQNNKLKHQQIRENYEQKNETISQTLTIKQQKLQTLQQEYANIKLEQSDRQRKIENKSKMFIGMLSH